MTTHTTESYPWRFFRAGGLDQVRIESGADIANLEQLDQKLWVALACPVKGLEFDEKTLALIDTDHDGRVRVREVLGAIAFCRAALKDLDGLVEGTDAVPLASVNEGTPEGKAILASARRILESLGKPGATAITLYDIKDTTVIFANTRFNGDGVAIPECADDESLKQVIVDLLATVDGVADRTGKMGCAQAHVDAFFDQLAAVEAWAKQAEGDPAILALGEGTAAAATAFGAVRAKVDDYFTRCHLVAFDERAQTALDRASDEYTALGAHDLSAAATEVAGFPLAHIAAGRPLPLADGLNPAWTAAMATLDAAVLTPILGVGRTSLTEAEWSAVNAKLAAYLAWAGSKPVTKAHELGIQRVRAILASTAKADIAALIEHDKSFEPEFSGIETVDKLSRLHRDLFRLLQNFTSFTDFYAPERLAVFQAGTLYLDSRACTLCVRVDDAGKHAAMAGLAKCYLAYCDCVRTGGEKMTIAAVFSGGDSDYLMVGRNGVFYDRKGRDWDATITKVVENPISLREAFFAPYKKFVRMVEEQIAKRAAAADSASHARLAGAAERTANLDKSKPAAPGIDLSTIALIGVAVSGAAAVVGSVLQAFFGLGWLMPLGIAGLILAISGPSMLIAALKLRQRNVGPVLDANGWAINGRVRVNIPFGGSLTHLPAFPAGSQRSFVDPYQPKQSPWVSVAWLAGALAVAAGLTVLGYHKGWLPDAVEPHLAFLGVPHHLTTEKEVAQQSVDDAKVVLASAQEQQVAAQKTYDDLIAAAEPPGPKLTRARARLERAGAKLARAEDKLDTYESRLEAATEALDAAVDKDEARVEADEQAAPL